MIFSAISCKSSPVNEKAMVQVWTTADISQEAPLAYGLAVGDGRQILTVINYEEEVPDTLYVGKPGQPRYPADIKIMDPRNSVTVLYMDKAVFPAADIAEAGSYNAGDNVTVHGWRVTDFKEIVRYQDNIPSIGGRFTLEEGPRNDLPGAIVTGRDGRVIGLLGTDYNTFVMRLGPPGMTSPMIDIHDALALLADSESHVWSQMPVAMVITTRDTLTGHASSQPPDSKYTEITACIQTLLGTMGEPLPADELPAYYRSFSWGDPQNTDGILLSVLYPRPVELRSSDGASAAMARWVGIQWGRSEVKPDRLLYGHVLAGNAVVDGGFVLPGGITSLANLITP
ncbi:MAG: hypothetical protein WC370_03825 [Dehalococcoidales bacterium]